MLLSRRAVAEAVGTFAIMFSGCGAIRVESLFPHAFGPTVISVVFGLVVAAMIYAVGHDSGAHFNPAVTMAFAVARYFPAREVFVYWAAQLMGALLAVGCLAVLLPGGSSFGATISHVLTFRALGFEFVLTCFWMFVIIAVATDTRAVGTKAGAAIGSTVMLGAFVGGPVTGASMNPARSLAPALAEGRYDQLWIYVVSPVLGAVTAALLYEWVRCDQSKPEPKNSKPAKGCC